MKRICRKELLLFEYTDETDLKTHKDLMIQEGWKVTETHKDEDLKLEFEKIFE